MKADEIPDDMKQILWQDTEVDQRVWICGTNGEFNEPFAYGPHYVVNVANRQLRNLHGRVFFHYAEDLLIMKE